MTRALLLSLFVFACGGSSKPTAKPGPPPPDPIPVTAGPTCKAVAEHVVTMAPAADGDLKAKFATMLETRCKDDKWSDEARSCFSTATSDEESEGCAEKKLTAEQRASVEAEIGKLVGEGNADMVKRDVEKTADKPDKPADKPKKGNTRAPTKKPKGGDPCQGGEDPCQGGQ